MRTNFAEKESFIQVLPLIGVNIKPGNDETRMSIKEQYWKYSLIAIVLLLGVVICWKMLPFSGGLMGAFTIYVLLRKEAFYLTEQRHWKKWIMALVLLLETLFFCLIPLALVVWLFISKIKAINLDPGNLLDSIQRVADLINAKTGYDLLSNNNIKSLVGVLPKIGQALIGSIGGFVINVLILLLVLYFMLTSGRRMEKYVKDILPFNRKNKKDVLHEFYTVVRSNAIGVPVLAVLQGGVAALGYYLFGVPEPVVWGVLSCFATIIPAIGVAIVWIPLSLYLGATGHWGLAVGLAVYSLVIVSNVDNLIRSLMQKKMADTHPLITIFGVIIGLSLFGFMGIIFGPLLLSVFALCVEIFRETYLDNAKNV